MSSAYMEATIDLGIQLIWRSFQKVFYKRNDYRKLFFS